MRIQFDRAGGLAAPAMRQSYTVESANLPADEANELKALVESAGIAELASTKGAAGAPDRPDMFRYRITVENDGKRHTAVFSDADMPAAIRPLISWLTRRASPGG